MLYTIIIIDNNPNNVIKVKSYSRRKCFPFENTVEAYQNKVV